MNRHDSLSQSSHPIHVPASLTRKILLLLGASAVVAAFVAWTDSHRFVSNSLVLFLFLLSVGLGGIFFVTLEYTVNANWSVPFRRISEVLAGLIPASLLLAWPVVFGLHVLYEWSHADVIAHDPILQQKALYLNAPFFLVRFALFYLVWMAGYYFLVRGSFRQDADGNPGFTKRAFRIAPVFMILLVVTVTFAAFDWIMSLLPHWYSSIFGVYLLVGTMVAGIASVTLVAARLKLSDRLPAKLTDNHFYNLGALLFALNTAWAYIAFAQFLLIWYGNLPQETVWFHMRGRNGWFAVSILLVVGHFFVPFLALLSRTAKCNPRRLQWVAVWVLLMHWLDLYWLVVPSVRPAGPVLVWSDLAFPVAAGCIAILVTIWGLSRCSVLPVKDPRLEAGLHFHL